MKTSRENKRLLSFLLSLALVFSVLGAAGAVKAEATGSEGVEAVSGGAVSGGAISGSAVNVVSNNGAIVDEESILSQFSASPAPTDNMGLTQADMDLVNNGTHFAKFKMEVDDLDLDELTTEETTQKDAIDVKAASEGCSILKYYTIDLSKIVDVVGATNSVPTPLIGSNALIKITIPLENEDLGKSNYYVYRYHDGRVEIITGTVNDDGEKIEIDNTEKTLTLYVKKFCVYALAYHRASGPIWYPQPVVTPTAVPTAEPQATAEPTKEPDATAEPTVAPTEEPVVPTEEPQPTAEPTAEPEPEKVVVKTMLLEATKITSTSTKLVWDKLPDADGYDLYQSKCNIGTKTYKIKYAKTFKSGEKHTYLLKGLKKGIWYKNRIYAWKMIDGKKVIIGKTLIVHHYHKKKNDKSKWGNPTGIKLSKTKLSVAKGKTAKLTAKALASGKDLGRHGKRIRYVVSNTAIASVSADGKVKGKKKGTCTVYVVAQSGLKKKVKVTVK